MSSLKPIFITRSDNRVIYVCLISILVSFSMIFLVNLNTKGFNLSRFFISIFFSLGIIGPFYVGLKYKRIFLTLNEIGFVFPFLFKKKIYKIENIKSMLESDYKIQPIVRGSRMIIYEGKQIHIEFKNTTEILTFNSYEIKDYNEFVKKLKIINKNDKLNLEEIDFYDSSLGFIIFGFILSLLLIFSALYLYS